MASASLAASIDAACGHTGSCWRLRNMMITPSLLSRSEMIISLKTIQYLLETCRPLLSDFEKLLLRDFVISLAGSMVKLQDGHIIISLCSGSVDAITELHEETELYAVINAACSPEPGDKDLLNSVRSNNPQPPTSPVTLVKNGPKQTTQRDGIHPSPECPSDPASDWG